MSYSYRTPFGNVQDFQVDVLGVPSGSPRMLSVAEFGRHVDYLREEIDEIVQAFMQGEIAGVADGIADLIFFAYGLAHQMGLPFDAIWTAVVAANMRKVKGETKRGWKDDAAKPENWVDPVHEIRRLIYEATKR